jgi:isopentenyl diphosphate isomerase/L-lactate dehydrogenase-like FMN-dependent dehydrogenase
MGAGGASAVVRMLEIIEQEIRITMALAGVARLEDLNPQLLERASPIDAPHVLSAFPHLDAGY